MCGIVGYIGNNAVTEELLNGLKNLEYRGYDSAGIALNDNQKIVVFKASGKLTNLNAVLSEKKAQICSSTVGIGHIRWATHGKPSIENAHPHLSNDGNLVLVHNGIIENYKELRQQLTNKGVVFHSQTDTEAAVHLFAEEYKKCGSLELAVRKGLSQIKGAFAFVIMHHAEPDIIIAVRKNAPLIIGCGNNENYVASDIPALLGKVKHIIHLDDDEMAVIKKDNVTVKDVLGNIIQKKIEKISLQPDVISKNGYAHFMLKEICEQPAILRNVLQKHIQNNEIFLDDAKIVVHWEKVRKVVIVACGTSLHAAMVAKKVWEEWLKIPVIIEVASEFIYQNNLIDENSLVIGVSQSGETADTITALKQAKICKAQIMVLTNRIDSSIVRYADSVVPLNAGVEISVAATKSYMAQLAAFYWIGLFMTQKINKISCLAFSEKLQTLREIPEKIEEILSHRQYIESLAQKLKTYAAVVFMARGFNLPTAYEAALKLKEISYINANAYPAGELKHGPIALLDEQMPVIALFEEGETKPKLLSNCEEAKARYAPVIGIGGKRCSDVFDAYIETPDTDACFSPLLLCVPIQLLAYYTAKALHREIDQPRNLAKSVTVE